MRRHLFHHSLVPLPKKTISPSLHVKVRVLYFSMHVRNVERTNQRSKQQVSSIFHSSTGIFLGRSMLTGGFLHSCLHRVRPLPGRTREERYSCAYLPRAEDDVREETLPGITDYATDKSSDGFTSRVPGGSMP